MLAVSCKDPKTPGDTGGGAYSDPFEPPCPDGTWGFISNHDRALFVDPTLGSDLEGSGRYGAPLATLEHALGLYASDGTFTGIALLAGTYEEGELRIADTTYRGLAIEGCGPEHVTLSPDDPSTSILEFTEVTEVRLAGVKLSEGTTPLIFSDGATGTVDTVAIEGAWMAGVVVAGGATSLEGNELVVTDTVAPPSSPDIGYGIAISSGTAALTGGGVYGARGVGILVDGTAGEGFGNAELTDVDVSDVSTTTDGSLGRGVQFQRTSNGLMVDCNITAVGDAGIFSLLGRNTQITGSTVSGISAGTIPDGCEVACTGDGIVLTSLDDGGPYDPKGYSVLVNDNIIDGWQDERGSIVFEGVSGEFSGNMDASSAYLDATSIISQGGANVEPSDTTNSADTSRDLRLNNALADTSGLPE